MLDRLFRLGEHQTTVRTEIMAGLTTFLTMAYIIFLQPMVLSGALSNQPTGMDPGAITTATCLSAAVASFIMGLYARYPIAQAPGMGENFFFVAILPVIAQVFQADIAAGETEAWRIALGVVFFSGMLFLVLSLVGIREAVMEAISPSMRDGIAVGIGVFITFIGLKNAGLIVADQVNFVGLTSHFASPDLGIFFFGLVLTAGLQALGARGAVLWGILASTALAAAFKLGMTLFPAAISAAPAVAESMLAKHFQIATAVVSAPPSLAPTFLKMDLVHALSWPMAPFIAIFLFMVLFDTVGTLVGVSEQAGFIKDNRLPRAKQAFVSDAVGTVVGAALGTSTVTSFIESAAGVQRGGRTGLTAVTAGLLFLMALLFSPIIAMVGSYPPITAPALVVVGAMMMSTVAKIAWNNFAEALPAFLVMVGIPLTFSIADGLALGFIAYPVVKLVAGQGREVKWLMYLMAVVLLGYFLLVRF
jgi:AGZA family xanthine/uracil permease-like MFS transporter